MLNLKKKGILLKRKIIEIKYPDCFDQIVAYKLILKWGKD